MDAIAEIKSRISIEDLVSSYVQLKKAGRNLKGLCPFHGEKTPSFMVSPDKQIAYCFGCHKGGDVFKFIQEVERIDFPEALKMLAERAGVVLEKEAFHPRDLDAKKKIVRAHELAAEFFAKNLWESPEGRRALSYVRDTRSFSESTIRAFCLGYAPAKPTALVDFLMAQGFSGNELVEGGLGVTSSIAGVSIKDRFVDRLIFPIKDAAGRGVIGFGGRALREEQEPKYLNSADSPLYNKSLVLYGFDAARDEIRACEKAIVVEGYMDVLRCHERGIGNAVATCGTALTPQQVKQLARFANTIVFFFDGDDAGRAAAERAFEVAQDAEMSVRVLAPPREHDPDSWLLHDRETVTRALQAAPDFFTFLIGSLKERFDPEDPAARKKLMEKIAPFFSRIKSRIERDFHIKAVAALIGARAQDVYDELSRIESKSRPLKRGFGREEGAESEGKPKKMEAAHYLLGCFLQYPSTWNEVCALLTEELFADDEQKKLYRTIRDTYNNARSLSLDALSLDALPGDLKEKAELYALYAESLSGSFSPEEIFQEVRAVVLKLTGSLLTERRRNLLTRIREAEKNKEREALEKLLAEYQALLT